MARNSTSVALAVLCITGLGGALVQAQSSVYQEPASQFLASNATVDPFVGAFTQSIPIAVPPYHGLEPGLGLSYSSTGGNGLAGVGWSLAGFPTIERASPGKGAPRYDASDIFLLGGEELIPCQPSSVSPSCTTGGTHSTKKESYQRIAYDAAGNTWTVWAPSGVKTIYRPLWLELPAQAAGNHARAGTAMQSSSYGSGGYPAANAIDGNTTSFSHTNSQAGAWWQVDLGAVRQIDTIKLWNRADCCQDRLNDYYVFADPTDCSFDVDRQTIANVTGSNAGRPSVYSFSQRAVRCVRVQLKDTNYLHPAEVEVIASSAVSLSAQYGWGIARVEDPKGNATDYGWACVTGETCYPSTVTYNGITVTVYRESRPDLQTYATGKPGLRTQAARVRSIAVKVGSELARVYKLTYTTNSLSGRSLLSSVQQFGRDAAVDAAGAISNEATAAKLPALTFGYQNTQETLDNLFAPKQVEGFFPSWHYWNTLEHGLDIADFNGDGRTDVLARPRNNYYWADPPTKISQYASTEARFLHGQKGDNNDSFSHFGGDTLVSTYWGMTSKLWDSDDFASVTGEFNGDGCADLLLRGTANTRILLSSATCRDGNVATMFDNVADITTSYGMTAALWDRRRRGTFTGDFDGDGDTDILIYGSVGTATGAGAHLLLGSGTGGFLPVQTVTTAWAMTAALWDAIGLSEKTTGDFNGDGYTDLIWRDATTGTVWQLLATGTGGFGLVPAGVTWSAGGPGQAVDLNSDGRDDLLLQNTALLYFSNGNGFEPGINVAGLWGTTGIGWNTAFHAAHVGDFSGDGVADILLRGSGNGTQAGGQHYVLIGKGDGTFQNAAELLWYWYNMAGTPTGEWRSSKSTALTADYNGDKQLDLLLRGNSSADETVYPEKTTHLVARGLPADLLVTVQNGIGGTTTVAYGTSAEYPQSNNPPLQHVVRSLTVSDGRGGSATTTYAYAGGLYDHRDKQFLGFRYARTTLPCITGESACPYTETWFKQDYGSVSKPERVDTRDGAGRLLTSTVHVYTTNGATVPYTSVETESWSYVYDGSGTACSAWPCAYGKRTAVTQTYDNYGNLTVMTNWGDYDASGDEHTVETTHVHNTASYILGKEADVKTWAGPAPGGTLLYETVAYYDGAGDWNQSPTAGILTRKADWSNTTGTFISWQTEWDAWGNKTAQIDPLGNRQETIYDSTYHLFPIETRDPLYPSDPRHKMTLEYDVVCGLPTRVVDMNGLVTTTQYDALCRKYRSDAPGGGFDLVSFANLGDPATQYMQTEAPGPDGSANLWARTYFDGLGRTWRTEAKGPSAGKEIRVDTAYNARGQVATTTHPYYADGVPVYETRSYDARDRTVRLTHPDGAFVATTFGLSTITTVDEAGHESVNELDAQGRVIAHQERLGSAWHAATYTYTVRGDIASTIDPEGNLTTYTFDSLGRKTQMVDPDMGTWTYEWDAAGRMVAQVDAKGQRTQMTYDVLGRVKTRTTLAGTAQAKTCSWSYDEARAGYYNVGRRTSGTDVAYDFDTAGRVIHRSWTIDGAAYHQSYGYDIGGRTRWIQYPDGDSIGTAASPLLYDGAGRLKAIPGIVTEFLYDATGNPVQQTNANGTVTTRGFSAERGSLTSIRTVKGATAIQDLVYGRNSESAITSVTSPFPNESWTYAYDELHRLSSATNTSNPSYNQTLSYSPHGNMLSNSRVGAYAYPAAGYARPHAVITAGPNTYSYDANGNMVSGAGRTITWDGANLPVAINDTTFAYDADGNRTKKTVGSRTTIFLGDDIEISEGTMTKYFSVGDVKVVKRVGNTTYWLHADHLQSIQAITDSAGVEVQRQKYHAFGERLSTATGHMGSLGFTSQRQDETGLFYLHARYFDPALSRFVSADPTVPSGALVGLNRYAYAYNDPVNFNDVTGLAGHPGGYGAPGAGTPPPPDPTSGTTNACTIPTSATSSGATISMYGYEVDAAQYDAWRSGSTYRPETPEQQRQSLDNLQKALSVVGMIPVLGEPADAVNGTISQWRAVAAFTQGNVKEGQAFALQALVDFSSCLLSNPASVLSRASKGANWLNNAVGGSWLTSTLMDLTTMAARGAETAGPGIKGGSGLLRENSAFMKLVEVLLGDDFDAWHDAVSHVGNLFTRTELAQKLWTYVVTLLPMLYLRAGDLWEDLQSMFEPPPDEPTGPDIDPVSPPAAPATPTPSYDNTPRRVRMI